jgi:hypothetical protein
MAINYPGPYEVRIFYTVTSFVHVQKLNVRLETDPTPGDDFSTINALRRDDAPYALDSEVDDWVVLMKAIYNTVSTTIDYAELWKYTPGTFDASFVSTYPIAVAGTSGTTTNAAGQYIITFRTTEGGIMKLSFMESIMALAARDTLPLGNAGADAIADAVVAGTSPWLARDTSYPFSCIAAYAGQNEALFKKRYRVY